MLRAIRAFFEARGVLEVETPLLCAHTVTDRHLRPFKTRFGPAGRESASPHYLQTSPEFAMKRLLAAGAGSIYQICKAFRNDELGRRHNPEFTILEWYRPGFDLYALMDEVEALFGALLDARPTPAERIPYRAVFERHTGIDPIVANGDDFRASADALGHPEAASLCGTDRSTWLDYLFSHAVQPNLGTQRLSFVYDFPACLPSLARLKPGDPSVVERVEVFLQGMELANGFHELADPVEQERRFDADLAMSGLSNRRRKDPRLLAALAAGLPDCSGIAVGLDRLLMLRTGADDIADVLAFSFANA
jgi:elongation factor P--(R)-beta-lysine ligase